LKLDEDKIKALAKDEISFKELFAYFESAFLSFAEANEGFFLAVRYFGNDSERPCSFSKSVEKVTGYTAEEIEALPAGLNSLIVKEDILKIKKLLAEFKENPRNKISKAVYRIQTKSGKTIWLEEIFSPRRDKAGNLLQIESAVFDVTDFIEKETELLNVQEHLKRKNAIKDKFISIVSHDLRSPFTSLLGFSEILLKEDDLPEEEKREYLEYIYDAAKSELELINDLLDWARLQTGKIKIQPKRLNLHYAVSSAVSVLTGNAIRKEVEIKTDIPDDLYVKADERLFHEAVKNLVANAIKFTPRGKRIFLKGNRFKNGVIELIIRDEGVGIPEKEQAKIFRLDEKFTLEGTEGEKGSGLGLALVKEIIDKHNGNIWFYSKEGEGTEFHITLAEARNKILIVEDDLDTRKLLRNLILKHVKNCDIIESTNGYEALTLMEKEIPTLLITDHEMPLMNGKQLVEAVLKKSGGIDIPVMIVSGKLDEKLKSEYQELGVASIVGKPIDHNLLSEELKRILS